MDILIFILMLFEAILMLVIFSLGCITIYFAFNSSFMRHSPPVPSCGKVKITMLEDVGKLLKKKSNLLVMDLGSGWGTLLLPLAKKFPNHRFVGIEYGCIPYLVSKFRARKMKNMTFYQQDFFKTDISKADVIFLFLLTSTMVKMEKKCHAEAKRGALIYANRFPMAHTKPHQEVSLGSKYNTYYIYKM